MYIYHLSIGPVAWSCFHLFPSRFRIVWSWTQKRPVGLINPYFVVDSWVISWSAEHLKYKHATLQSFDDTWIHDQHSISLVEYVYDARRWYVSPFMTECYDFILHPDFSNAEDETISTISLFQPEGYASWEYMWLPKPRGALGVSNN